MNKCGNELMLGACPELSMLQHFGIVSWNSSPLVAPTSCRQLWPRDTRFDALPALSETIFAQGIMRREINPSILNADVPATF